MRATLSLTESLSALLHACARARARYPLLTFKMTTNSLDFLKFFRLHRSPPFLPYSPEHIYTVWRLLRPGARKAPARRPFYPPPPTQNNHCAPTPFARVLPHAKTITSECAFRLFGLPAAAARLRAERARLPLPLLSRIC